MKRPKLNTLLRKMFFTGIVAMAPHILFIASSVYAAPVTFSDEIFANANWTATKIQDTGPSEGGFTVNQVSAGGNPNEYRSLQQFWSGPGRIITAHLRDGAIYDPGIQGAISSLAFSFDLILFQGGSANMVGYRGLILQNGTYYSGEYTMTSIGILNQWISRNSADLAASDFTLISGSGPQYPDFSASAPPIQLGYAGSNGRSFAGSTNTDSGIDNWSVSISRYASECEASAIYSVTDRRITFATLAMEFYNPVTDEPDGRFALFTGDNMSLKALPGFYDFRYKGGEPVYAEQIVEESDNCYPTYSARKETVHFPKITIPFVSVFMGGNTINGPDACYEASFKLSTIQAGVFTLTEALEVTCE